MFDGGTGSDFSRRLSYWIRFIEQHLEGIFHDVLDLSLRMLMPHPILESTVHRHQLIIPAEDKLSAGG